jgi:hypothetical protein
LFYEHFAESYVDFTTLDEDYIDMKCTELFNMKPIIFQAKKGEYFKLQKELERLIQLNQFTIPIVHVKGMVYLIGAQKSIMQFNGDQLMVRVGGGYFRFEEYIP